MWWAYLACIVVGVVFSKIGPLGGCWHWQDRKGLTMWWVLVWFVLGGLLGAGLFYWGLCCDRTDHRQGSDEW